MRLLVLLAQIPLIPALAGCTLLLFSWQRISAARTPAVSTWCGDGELVGLYHVRLRDCEVGTSYLDGRAAWVALHRPGAAMPSVLVHFSEPPSLELDAYITEELAAGTLDVARTAPDAGRVSALRIFPELEGAVFVGDWRPDGGADIDRLSGVMIFFGSGLILADCGRIAMWFLRRLRGRARR